MQIVSRKYRNCSSAASLRRLTGLPLGNPTNNENGGFLAQPTRRLWVWIGVVWIACVGGAGTASAWNASGHEAVGAIADRLIAGTPAATQVAAILGMDLRTASVWADCVKGVSLREGAFVYTVNPRYPECRPFENATGRERMVDFVARNWNTCHPAAGEDPCYKQYHYTDVAVGRDRYARSVGTSDHDIVAAIGATIRVLRHRAVPKPFSIRDSQEALLLLAHLVGDLHQPLHVGAIYLDPAGHAVDPDRGVFDPNSRTRGGNRLLDGGRTLHGEWDEVSSQEFLAEAAAPAPPVPASRGPWKDWPTQWASDTLLVSREVFRGVIFGEENLDRHTWSVTVPPDYAERRQALQRRQLSVAGARLAALLEKLFPRPATVPAAGR